MIPAVRALWAVIADRWAGRLDPDPQRRQRRANEVDIELLRREAESLHARRVSVGQTKLGRS